MEGCRASAEAEVLMVGTVRIPPIVALLVTESAVPAAENVVAPVNVFADTPDCVYPPEEAMPVTPDKAPVFIIKPLIVFTVVGADITPIVARAPIDISARVVLPKLE